MNWKLIAIILIIVVVLVGAYSGGYFLPDKADDGTSEITESFDVSASVQSDFWDGFGDWLWANLWWMCLTGAGITLVGMFVKSRN